MSTQPAAICFYTETMEQKTGIANGVKPREWHMSLDRLSRPRRVNRWFLTRQQVDIGQHWAQLRLY